MRDSRRHSARASVIQSNPNVGLYLQDEWKVGSRLTLNLGIRYDLQYLETIETDRRQRVATGGRGVGAIQCAPHAGPGECRCVLRPCAAAPLANALLSAGNTTDLSGVRQIAVSLSPAQAGRAGVSEHPGRGRALGDAAESDDDAARFAERLLETGKRGDRAADRATRDDQCRLSVFARTRTADGGEPERAGLRAVREQQRMPSESELLEQYPVLVRCRLRLSRLPRFVHPTSDALGPLPGVLHAVEVDEQRGEFFFSQPIDPFDLSKDWGRSDNDQRHRLVLTALSLTHGPATTAWQRISHGFHLTGTLQAYSALPFNITSGVTTIQGTPGRPDGGTGRSSSATPGTGRDFFTLNTWLSSFLFPRGVRFEGIVEGFNLTNRLNVLTRNTNFGVGSSPDDPSPSFGQITAVANPDPFQ